MNQHTPGVVPGSSRWFRTYVRRTIKLSRTRHQISAYLDAASVAALALLEERVTEGAPIGLDPKAGRRPVRSALIRAALLRMLKELEQGGRVAAVEAWRDCASASSGHEISDDQWRVLEERLQGRQPAGAGEEGGSVPLLADLLRGR